MCALAAIGLLTLLVVSASLKPDEAGYGTHTQLGLPPCPGILSSGRPCATCGMTTAFAYAAHGQFVASFRAQPFGALMAVGSACTIWVLLHVAATGSRLGSVTSRLLAARFMWLAIGLALAAWGYKLWVTPVGG